MRNKKKGTKRTVENLVSAAKPKVRPAQRMFHRDGSPRDLKKKYVATSIPNTAATSVVTKCPWARTLGDKPKSRTGTKPQSLPNRRLDQKYRKRMVSTVSRIAPRRDAWTIRSASFPAPYKNAPPVAHWEFISEVQDAFLSGKFTSRKSRGMPAKALRSGGCSGFNRKSR